MSAILITTPALDSGCLHTHKGFSMKLQLHYSILEQSSVNSIIAELCQLKHLYLSLLIDLLNKWSQTGIGNRKLISQHCCYEEGLNHAIEKLTNMFRKLSFPCPQSNVRPVLFNSSTLEWQFNKINILIYSSSPHQPIRVAVHCSKKLTLFSCIYRYKFAKYFLKFISGPSVISKIYLHV